MFKLNTNKDNEKEIIKQCKECGEFKPYRELVTNGGRIVMDWCKQCCNKKRKGKYNDELGSFIYMIRVDGVIKYIGSAVNIRERIDAHRTNKNGFLSICKRKGISLEGKDVTVWVCDTEEMGYCFDETDRRYYEHKLIRQSLAMGDPLVNTRTASRFIERDRYIDEIPMDGFIFKKRDDLCLKK